MTALSDHLERLLRFLESADPQPPTRNIRLFEVRNGQAGPGGAKLKLRRGDLRIPSDFEARFDDLLGAGYAWLNVSCYGVCDNFLIVGIEVPGSRRIEPGGFTSVNLSGPPRIVLDYGWNADAVLTIE